MPDSSDTAEPRVRPLRSFVLREGRLTSAQQRALTELWPRYGLTPNGTLDFSAIFGRQAPVWLEIGFGNGEALHHMAGLYPEIDFVGIEVHRPGVGRLLNALERDGLTNVRVICADASEVIRGHIARGALERVLVFFPDPWPKKRHHKRRLIQPDFTAELVRVLPSGGMLHLATDWADYAEHMQAVLTAEPGLENTADGGARRPEYRPQTRFELRGVNKGHAVVDLLYRATA
ncbi:MAG: tRNA (guanosine(46)-N7)-methyltransferase TrmB [Halofilum sp. (in: g-proteobacteria)]